MQRGSTISAIFPRLSSQCFFFPIRDTPEFLLFPLGWHLLMLQLRDFTGSTFSFLQKVLHSLLQGIQKQC